MVSKVKTVSVTDYLAEERGETAVLAGHYRDYRGKTTSSWTMFTYINC